MFVDCLFAQIPQKISAEDCSWRMLERAQIHFDQGEYGLAVKYAELARENRKKECDWELAVFSQPLKLAPIKKVGDSLSDVRDKMEMENCYDAVGVIDSYVLRKGYSFFNNSVKELKKYIQDLRTYPEADYLLGKIYVIEGEYKLADKYYTNAWKAAHLLDIPNQKYSILYDMAYLSKVTSNDDEFEKTLLLIVSEDGTYIKNGTLSPFVKSVTQSIRKGMSMDKFFMLYRVDSVNYQSAYLQLAEFYYQRGKIDQAMAVSSLGVLSAFTTIYQAIKDYDIDYKYSSFDTYLKIIGSYSNILEWSAKNEVWRGFYYFAKIIESYGQKELARSLLQSLANNCPEDYWKNLAKNELGLH